ncbi:MAG: response regulator transcription factor [Saprospiraceae bacterium]|nr:response regulator transcription factor [Saprospiraceae bacterium]
MSQTILTVRENELIKLLAEGYLNKEIADQLHVSLSTVKTISRTFISNYMSKTEAKQS